MKMMHDKHRRLVPRDPKTDPAVNGFLRKIGIPRLIEALKSKQNDQDGRFLGLAKCLEMPKYRRWHPNTLARKWNITLKELNDCWLEYIVASTAMQHVEKTLEDTFLDSQARVEGCPRCFGIGEISVGDSEGATVLCPRCLGEKRIRIPGDRDARNTAFEVLGLTGGKRAPFVLNQTFGNNVFSLQSLVGQAERLLEQKPEPKQIEMEAVEP